MQDDAVKPGSKEHKMATQDASTKSSAVSNEIQSMKPNEAIPAGSKAAPEISAERQAVLAKHDILREESNRRLGELVKKARDGLDEEDFHLPSPTLSAEDGEFSASSTEFPDFAISSLALVVQERYVLQCVFSSIDRFVRESFAYFALSLRRHQ